MKKITTALILFIPLFFVSCTSNKGDKQGTKTMSIAAANSFQSAGGNDGKEITVEGYVWGVRDMKDGGKALALGDELLSGVKMTSFLCKFPQEKASETDGIDKDMVVVVSGKIAKGYGGSELTDCKILAIKK